MPKKLYDCVCGKKHKSRQTVLNHKRKAGALPTSEKDEKKAAPLDVQNKAKPDVQSYNERVVEIDLKPEFENMVEEMKPKAKKNEPQDGYKCPICETVYKNKVTKCAVCNTEFEE